MNIEIVPVFNIGCGKYNISGIFFSEKPTFRVIFENMF